MLYFRKIIKFELHIRTNKKIEVELIFYNENSPK